MIGCLSIDFRPSGNSLPRLLEIIDAEDFALRGLRVLPCAGEERSTLRLDIGGCPSRPRLDALERRLRACEQVIDVIHWAGAAPRPG